MPRAIVLSIVVVVVLYVAMSTAMLAVIPWQEARQTRTIASLFIARTFADPGQGHAAALVMTGLILFIAISSLFAVVLGYSRVPFAAASRISLSTSTGAGRCSTVSRSTSPETR